MLPQGWREEALHSPEQNAPGTWKPGSATKQNMSPGSWRANGVKLLPEDSKGFDKHKTLNSRTANSSKGSEADWGHRMPAEPDELAQSLPGAKDEPREIRTSIRMAKSILCSSSTPQMYWSQALHAARYEQVGLPFERG